MIQIHGVITDPAGQAVPGAIIELRSLNTTGEVLMGSVLTFKCDPAGGYRFQLAAGTYDVYAQNDLCGDMDYLGTGVVTAQSAGGPLNSILVDSGINLTPPLLERAVEAMNRSESAARATEQDKQQTGSDVIATELASNSAAKHANAAAASALVAGNAEKGVTEKAADVDQNTRRVADHAARVEVQSAGVAKSAATIAQQSLAVAAIEKAVTEMRDVVVTKTTAAQSAATNAGSHASNAEKAALATESAKVVTLEKAGRVDTQAQQVSADSNLVQEYAGQVETHAATVAEQAKEVIVNAGAVSQAKTAVQGMQKTVVVKTAQAQAAADTASGKASQAAQDQAAASASARRASLSESMAEAWAQNPEGIDINGRHGEFSALHWAMQAQKWAKAITSQLVWLGAWNAAAGTPPTPAAHQGIPFYRISHDGVIAGVSYLAGDYLHWDPATKGWFKIDGSDAVISVNGMTGAVVLSAADVGARPASWVPRWADITNKPVSMPPSEHSHPWSQLSNVPIYASRWPTLAEIGAAAADHNHPWSQLTGIPVFAKRWPAWTEVTGKPELAAAKHRHPWSQIDQIPVTASRWPSWAEVTDKPALAAADHTHPYMANGGSYGTLYLNNWFRSTGATGWYNETYGGGIYMEDTTWVRTYNGKKFHVSNTEGDCVSLAGGIYAAGNANVNDVYIRSDYRLKSNFEPISDALCKVRQLSGKIYDKAGRREAGLIAQDVAKVQPESVYLNEDGYLSLASTGILALVVEALKELGEKVEALDDRSS
ncbi:tail fiber domain-containing protein [Aeromonas hydrophila]|uniref:tail fiber domain-containing protein n=1 Tax=Aeromonas hydrophila TaxID=644 RepID=UPI002B487E4D|nr:tail fiber domain-containing protein [Aeromonas hydrophila]